MTAILKVDTIQDTAGNNIINESSDTITIGASGDTIDVPGTEVKTNKVSPTSGTSLQIGDSGDTVNIVGTLQNNGAALVTGKVLQVVQKIDTTDRTTTSSTYTSGIGGALQIQPSATSSKILIMASVLVYRTSATGYLTLAYQGSSLATNSQDAFAITDGNSRYYATSGLHFLHSPNTTNLVSYDVLMKTNDNTSPTVQCANNYAQAVLTLMEIAG